jgi:hypothetical protein
MGGPYGSPHTPPDAWPAIGRRWGVPYGSPHTPDAWPAIGPSLRVAPDQRDAKTGLPAALPNTLPHSLWVL